MTDEENPYAPPRTSTANVSFVVAARHNVPDPGVSRFLTYCLAVNVISWPLVAFFSEVRGLLKARGLLVLADTSSFLVGLSVVWMLVGWPLSSVAALIYTATKDRGTQWWLPKSIAAALLLVLWLLACGLLGLLISSGAGDDF